MIINIVRGWPPSSRVSRVGAQTVSLGVGVIIADLDREASSTRRGSGEARKGRAPLDRASGARGRANDKAATGVVVVKRRVAAADRVDRAGARNGRSPSSILALQWAPAFGCAHSHTSHVTVAPPGTGFSSPAERHLSRLWYDVR